MTFAKCTRDQPTLRPACARVCSGPLPTPPSGWRACWSPRGCASTSPSPTCTRRPSLLAAAIVVVVHVTIGWLFGPYAVGPRAGLVRGDQRGRPRRRARRRRPRDPHAGCSDVIDAPAQRAASPRWPSPSLGMFAARFLIRSRRTHLAVRIDSTKRAVIFGAGSGGRILVQSLVRDPSSGIVPVALLDDDPHKARLHFSGVRVRGTRARPRHRRRQARRHHAGHRRAERHLRDRARAVRPGPRRAASTCWCFRPCVSCSAAAPRPPTCATSTSPTCSAASRSTSTWPPSPTRSAASGCSSPAPAARSAPSCAARSASSARRTCSCSTATRAGCTPPSCPSTGRATLDSDDLLLCDIRDVDALRAAFERSRPEIVFHAAALKHLTMLERNPSEAFKTNVLGTRNVLEAASAVGVETFVNISTDKAARPTCVLGWSKRVAERLTASFDGHGRGRYISVRFGNVLGSRGSVVPAFTRADQPGRPGHRHPPRRRALLHAHPRGLPAGAPGRRHRARRRGDGARHGRPR